MINTFIDLFAGIGGFRLALEAQGLRCVFSSEIDKDACDVYEANFGERPAGDITKIDAKDIPDHDVLCGGFPCQPFSEAGKQKGLNEIRGTLFFDIIRIASEKRPKILLLENVEGLVRKFKDTEYPLICEHIRGIGYDLQVYNLDAMYYGVPHKRVRLYFVAIRKDVLLQSFKPESKNIPVRAGDIMLAHDDPRCPEPINPEEINYNRYPREYELKPYVSCIIGHPNKTGRLYRDQHSAIMYNDRPIWCMCTWIAPRIDDGEVVRYACPREMARLSGFPDTFALPFEGDEGAPFKRHAKLFGNTVIPRMVSLVFHGITSSKQTDLFR